MESTPIFSPRSNYGSILPPAYSEQPSGAEPANSQVPKFSRDEEESIRSKRRLLDIGLIFVLFLVILPVMFLIMTFYLRASLPSPEDPGEVYDLKQRISELSNTLATCTTNSSALANEVGCLKREIDRGAYIQFLDYVGKTGTGGDSWVCSDDTPYWSFGYTSTDAPHPSIKIQTWISDLDNVQHSNSPLIFPPTFDFTESDAGSEVTLKDHEQMPMETESVSSRDSIISDSSARIVGYTVKSLDTSRHNGWWRLSKPPAFGVEGGTLEFFAVPGGWFGNSARYKVMVYWATGPDMYASGCSQMQMGMVSLYTVLFGVLVFTTYSSFILTSII